MNCTFERKVKLDNPMEQLEKKSLALLLTFSLLFLAVSVSVPPPCGGAENQDLEFTIQSSVTYFNNGTGVWNFTEDDRTIGLFMNNSWQTVNLTECSFPIEKVTNDEDGNPYAVLQFNKEKLDPGGNISYTVKYRITSKPRPLPNINEENSSKLDEIPESLREEYCGPEGPWQVNDTGLQELAQNIKGNETRVLTIVKGFIKWIKMNINYSSHEVPLYPNETYARREGDCDEQAMLLVALCRICGIPAFLQIGCIYISTYFTDETYWDGHVRNVQVEIGWHGWAMVYVPPWGWLPADLTYVWGGIGEDYLNAIRRAAVTSQHTIQYMNITKIDYVNLTAQTKDFLQANGFYVYMKDEMTQETERRNIWQEQIPWILIAAGTTIIVVEVVLYIRKRKGKAVSQQELTPVSPNA
jgi:hypothetical protein